AAQVTVTRIDATAPAAVAGLNGKFGAVGVPLESRIDSANHEPVAALRRHISVEAGWTGNRGDEHIQGAVVVDVPTGQRTRDRGGTADGSIRLRDIPEAAPAVVYEKLVALGVRTPERSDGRTGPRFFAADR